ncbi:MAG: EAL domain-containing protein [Pseudomonadota bacterium]
MKRFNSWLESGLSLVSRKKHDKRSLRLVGLFVIGLASAAFLFASLETSALIVVASGILTGTLTLLLVSSTMSRSVANLDAVSKQFEMLYRSERALSQPALTDPLTGLPNRRAMLTHLEAMIDKARSKDAKVALLVIDLDGFKPINDGFGHQTGDEVLVEVATRISFALKEGQFLSRFGGDEFAVTIFYSDYGEVISAMESILDHTARSVSTKRGSYKIGASVGCSIFPDDGNSAEQLIWNSDQAMYKAKRLGGNRFIHFDQQMKADIEERRRIENRVGPAIERGDVRPFFQPLVELKSGNLIGFEALARWQDDEMGMVMPDKFIGAAERTGVVEPLTLSMMDSVCVAAAQMPSDLLFAVNLSPIHLRQPDFARRLIETAEKYRLQLSRFEFEVTENTLIADVDTARKGLLELKARGASIALDDFGAGYSSLQYIRALPFDKVKIDRIYVRDITENEGSTIVNAVLSLAASLAFTTTAEGIEDEETAEMLRILGCNRGQGWHYGKPMPMDEAIALANASRGFDGARSKASATAAEPRRPGHADSVSASQSQKDYRLAG